MRHISLIDGLLGGMGLIVLSLWYSGRAPVATAPAGSSRSEWAAWSVRLAATAGIAAAQVLFLTFVVGRIRRPARFDTLLRRAAGLTCGVALAGAVTFALLARY